MKGCFIVFEGIDGAGKTCQFNKLGERLQKEDYNIVLTKEPTSNRVIGKLIRNILYKDVKVSDEALALLFAADRVDHTKNVISPALKKGSVVLSDRYIHSSLAYQCKGMKTQLDLKWLKTINRFAISPDIVVFLDIPPEEGLKRLQKGQVRVQDDGYFRDIIKQEKIRSAYYKVLNFKRKEKDLMEFQEYRKKDRNQKMMIFRLKETYILRIDGMLPEEEITKLLFDFIKKYLEKKHIPKIKKNSPSVRAHVQALLERKIE